MFGDAARDAAVDDIDDATDGRRSEQQCRRPAQYFDAFGRQRIDDNGVIDTGIRNIDAADPVLQNADTLALKAAKHRAAGIGPKGCCRNTRQMRKRFTNRRAQLSRERRAG